MDDDPLPESLSPSVRTRYLLGRLDRLTDRQWQAVIMRAQGATYAQIARVMGLSVEGVREILLAICWRYRLRAGDRDRLAALVREAFLG